MAIYERQACSEKHNFVINFQVNDTTGHQCDGNISTYQKQSDNAVRFCTMFDSEARVGSVSARIDLASLLPQNVTHIISNGVQTWSWATIERVAEQACRKKNGKNHIYTPSYGDKKDGRSHGVIVLYNQTNDQATLIAGLPDGMSETTFSYEAEDKNITVNYWLDGKQFNIGDSFTSDIIIYSGTVKQVTDAYQEKLAAHLDKKAERRTRQRNLARKTDHFLWPSWGKAWGREIIIKNLAKIAQLEEKFNIRLIDYFLFDDGWQRAIGDCEEKPGINLHSLIDLIHKDQRGGERRKAGVWLSLFEVAKNSNFAKENPDWLLHDTNDQLVSMGRRPFASPKNIPEPIYLLDIRKPEVKNYIRRLGRRMTLVYGFDLVKLDYLSHAFNSAMIDQSGKRTRVEIYREAMEAFIDGANDGARIRGVESRFILCGAPIYASMMVNRPNVEMRFTDDAWPATIRHSTPFKFINRVADRVFQKMVSKPQKWFNKAQETQLVRTLLFGTSVNFYPDGMCLNESLGVSRELVMSYLKNVLTPERFATLTFGDDLIDLDLSRDEWNRLIELITNFKKIH